MDLDPNEAVERIKYLKEFQFAETRFHFINDHYGLRPGNIHLLMGTSGKGKSTLARSIMLDVARFHKVFFLTSEEEERDVKDRFHLSKTHPDLVKNITHYRDTDLMTGIEPGDVEGFLSVLSWHMLAADSEILFYDNLTASLYYETLTPTMQAKFV